MLNHEILPLFSEKTHCHFSGKHVINTVIFTSGVLCFQRIPYLLVVSIFVEFL
jgi:hypothetical protein